MIPARYPGPVTADLVLGVVTALGLLAALIGWLASRSRPRDTGDDSPTESPYSLAGRPTGRVISLILAVGEGIGSLVAILVLGAGMLRGTPISGLAVLAIVAIPLLIAGQLWTIAVIWSRKTSTLRRRPVAGHLEFLRLVFGPLNPAAVAVIVVVFVAAWLAAMSGFSAVTRGGPTAPSADCPYRRQNHTGYTCVSKADYDRAGAGEQRIFAGVLLCFLSMHTGTALSVLARRRTADVDRTKP